MSVEERQEQEAFEGFMEQAKKPKRKISNRARVVLIVLGVILVLGLVGFGVFKILQWRNDGERYAARLSEQIGVSPETAQKYAHITLANASEFASVNAAAEEYPYIYESKKTVKVSGVSIPEWVIYLSEVNNTLTEVVYYNYNQLQKFGNGVKTKGHIEHNGITMGMTPEAVQAYIGFAPLRMYYSNEGLQEAYKYYYKDQNTGNTVSYVLYVNYADGQAVSAAEEENQFIVAMLTLD